MKFDKIIMNPPYGSRPLKLPITLHYDITSVVKNSFLNPESGVCISLMPNTLIRSSYDGKKSIELKNDYNKDIISFEEIENSNDHFGTLMKNVGIYVFDKTKKLNDGIHVKTLSKEIDIYDLNNFNDVFSDMDIIILKKYKIGNFVERRQKFQVNKKKSNFTEESLNEYISNWFVSHKKYFDKYEYYIIFNAANGGMNAIWQNDTAKKFGIFEKSDICSLLKSSPTMKSFIGFKDNELESCKSLLNLLDKDCLRYPLLKYQDDQNMCPRVYQGFPDIDYSNIKSEEDFYVFFDITKEEQNYIHESMEKYK